MYPFIKFAVTLFRARRRLPIDLQDRTRLELRAGLTDVDMFLELNNARYLSYAELGRWDYSQRAGYVEVMKRKGWGIAVGGANLRYRRRIPLFAKFTLETELVCHDGRWFYFLQEFYRDGKICASALLKVCAVSKQGLVPAEEVLAALGKQMSAEVPAWIGAWIEAEGERPWPASD